MFDFRKSLATSWRPRASAGLLGAVPAGAQTLKVVMHSDVKILDPIWTTAYIQRNHGYMVWDTLFAMDEKFEVKPQMVDKYDVSADKLTWTFTLRDGLEWHDGKPVTSEDCIASIKRWAARDSMGQKMMGSVADFEVGRRQDLQDEDEGAVRPGAAVARQAVVERALHDAEEDADTDPMHADQGRGRDRLRPVHLQGRRMEAGREDVYVKNTKYKPRAEPPSGLAGGKVVKVDRVEWIGCPTCRPRSPPSRTARST